MVQLLLAVASVLGLSALCSSTEAALFSVSMIKVRQLVQNKGAGALALLKIREDMSRPIATIVIFNNVANIVGSAVIGRLVTNTYGDTWVGLAAAILTFLVIIFSEIIPKNLGEQYCEKMSLVMARPVLFMSWLLKPLHWLLELITSPFTKSENSFITNEAEIKLMAHLGQKEGIIGKKEGDMIARVFELNDLTAGDLLTPRVVITWLRGSNTLNESRDEILNSPHSRILIAEDEVDVIEGFVLKGELLGAMVRGKGDMPLRSFSKKVRYVPRQIKADALLLAFRRSRQHLAVVLDEFGGVAGVVTLEDVLEVLTGEIMDETDKVEDLQEVARKRRRLLKPEPPDSEGSRVSGQA